MLEIDNYKRCNSNANYGILLENKEQYLKLLPFLQESLAPGWTERIANNDYPRIINLREDSWGHKESMLKEYIFVEIFRPEQFYEENTINSSYDIC